MSDDQQDQIDTTDETPQASEWNPPASQAELDRIIQNRLERERAKFADYESLAEKAQYWDEIEQASQTEHERLQEELARWQNEASTWRTQAVSSRVERLAADRFADPSDALAAIDPNKYLGAGGEIDEAAIRADLDAVLDRKPHWRKSDATAPQGPRIPARNPAQGSGVNGKSSANPADELAAILRSQLGT